MPSRGKQKQAKAVVKANPRSFQDMADDEILERCIADYNASQSFQKKYFEKFERLYRIYRSYIPETQMRENGSNLFIPYSYQLVETIVPKIVNALFSTRPYVQTMPLGYDNAQRVKRAEKMNKLLDYQFQQRIKIIPIVTDVLKTTSIYGTAITMQLWKYKKRVIKTKENTKLLGISLPGVFREVEKEVAIDDDPCVIHIPLWDFFFDPAGTTIDDCRYCIRREYVDLHELLERKENAPDMYKNLDELTEDYGSGVSPANVSNPMLQSIGMSHASDNARKGIEILHVWTDDWVVGIADKKYVIYSMANPFYHHKKPFSRWVATSVPNEFYGIGDIEAIEQLQYELNTTRNQRIDNVAFVLNRMWKVRKGANIDTTQLVSRPAGFIEVDEMDDIEDITFQDVTASSYNEEMYIKADMDATTGVHDTERGSTPKRRETATTMNILATAAGERFKLRVLLAEYDGLHEMVNQIMALNQQYIDQPKELTIIGNDGTMDNDVITPDEIIGEWALVAVGSALEPSVNRDARQQNLVQLYALVKDRPDINHKEMLKAIFGVYDIRNIDTMFMAEAPQPPEMPPAGMQLPGMPSVGGAYEA